MSRKNRSDSHTTEGEMLRTPLPKPPEHIHLPDDCMAHWWAIVGTKAADAWTAHDLEYAAELARCQADLERLRGEIRAEGDIIDGKLNPKRRLEDQLVQRAIRLSRLLQVHALATQGRSGDQTTRNKAARKLRESGDDVADDDGLLAKPDKTGMH